MFYEYQHFGLSDHFHKEYGKNFNYPGHLHQSFELITVLSGRMQVTVDSRVYNIKPLEAVLVFPNQVHSLSCENCEHMLCIFSPEIIKSFSAKTANKTPSSNKFPISSFSVDAIDKLTPESTKTKKKGVLYYICSEFDENVIYTDKKIDDGALLYKIFQFVEQNFNKDCSLETLSKETAFSYSYLSRYFKRLVSMSYNSYVNLYRISKACYVLNNSNCSILQCALECGYTSLRTFNRNFKLHTSVTPQEYREQSK